MPADLALDLGAVYSNRPPRCNNRHAFSVLHFFAVVALANIEVTSLLYLIRDSVLRNSSDRGLEVALVVVAQLPEVLLDTCRIEVHVRVVGHHVRRQVETKFLHPPPDMALGVPVSLQRDCYSDVNRRGE